MASAADKSRRAEAEPDARGSGQALSVVHLVAEYFPYARSGGLAEAVRGIATSQARHAVETLVFLPLYLAAVGYFLSL